MATNKTKGKNLPKLDPAAISTDFFSTSSQVLLKAVNQGTEKIEEFVQEKPEKEDKKHHIDEKKLEKEKEGEENTGTSKVSAAPKEQTGEVEAHKPQRGRPRKIIESTSSEEKFERKTNSDSSLISFLKEEGRSNTRPVRLLESNYQRVLFLKKHFNSTKSVSELIDFILGDYLDKVEKKLEKEFID